MAVLALPHVDHPSSQSKSSTAAELQEAVALAGMKRLGRQSDLLPRIATGFGGGLSRTKSVVRGADRRRVGAQRGLWPWQAGRRSDVLVSKVQTLVDGSRSLR